MQAHMFTHYGGLVRPVIVVRHYDGKYQAPQSAGDHSRIPVTVQEDEAWAEREATQ